MHLCRHHKGLHILGDWWPWPSTMCCCVSVLEDGGGLLQETICKISQQIINKGAHSPSCKCILS